MPSDALLSFEDVGLLRADSWILKKINWQIRPKEHWVVLGANGAGKSTLAALALARIWPTEGRVSVLGQSYAGSRVQELSSRIGFFQPMQQEGLSRHHPNMSVLELLLTGFDGSLAPYRKYTSREKKRAASLFQSLWERGLCHYGLRSRVRLLSTGERRQVLLLRALVSSPRLLFLDEPYESFDIPSRLRLEALLARLVETELEASALILHRIEEIPAFVSHALLLKNGRALFSGPLHEALRSNLISELYEYPLEIRRVEDRWFCLPKQ